jgi:hypothetical protein
VTVYKFTYRHNNSGGVDWITPEQWQEFVDNGWTVTLFGQPFTGGRGSCASLMIETDEGKEVARLIGMQNWYAIAKQDPDEIGCTCCGPPHSFSVEEVEQPDPPRSPWPQGGGPMPHGDPLWSPLEGG